METFAKLCSCSIQDSLQLYAHHIVSDPLFDACKIFHHARAAFKILCHWFAVQMGHFLTIKVGTNDLSSNACTRVSRA
jgi:hypothetical protein